jgi:hypothetical protein
MMFEAVWRRLTLAQRAVLRAVVLEEEGGCYRGRGRDTGSADHPRSGGAGGAIREGSGHRDAAGVSWSISLLREWVAPDVLISEIPHAIGRLSFVPRLNRRSVVESACSSRSV